MKNRNILILIIVAGVSAVFWWSSSNVEKPTSGKPLVTVKVPTLSGEAIQGERLFNANCSSCHGVNAAGQKGVAPPLIHIIYETGHHGDVTFYRANQFGVRQHHWPFGDMQPVGVQQADMSAIIVYIRTVQRANGIQ
ncbi:MAG: cytochrome C [Alphaproteobacteria bacterium]|nr:MAG: cytochrome C [Alphaproteobacteria bacterium]